MGYIENILRNAGLTVRKIPKSEWLPDDERAAMRDEMRSRFAENEAYRRRSMKAMKR